MEDDAASRPPADRDARGGDAAGLDADGPLVLVDRGVAVLARLHGPPLRRRVACNGDVTAEAHEHASRAHGFVRRGRGQVCSQGFGRGPEVDLDAGRNPNRARGLVELDGLPAWNLADR